MGSGQRGARPRLACTQAWSGRGGRLWVRAAVRCTSGPRGLLDLFQGLVRSSKDPLHHCPPHTASAYTTAGLAMLTPTAVANSSSVRGRSRCLNSQHPRYWPGTTWVTGMMATEWAESDAPPRIPHRAGAGKRMRLAHRREHVASQALAHLIRHHWTGTLVRLPGESVRLPCMPGRSMEQRRDAAQATLLALGKKARTVCGGMGRQHRERASRCQALRGEFPIRGPRGSRPPGHCNPQVWEGSPWARCLPLSQPTGAGLPIR